MKNTITLSRREFTLEAVLALLSGAVITISGCGGDSNPAAPPTPTPNPTPTPTPAAGDRTGTVSANHGHIATIDAARLMAGNAVSLDIRGGADHAHTVDLSAAEVMAIAANQRVSKQSSSNFSHDHTVTFN
jgi:hypothetical protein